MTSASVLYPPVDARRADWLATTGGHEVYWEESGRPDGIPALFVHGGPGGACDPKHRRYFDPDAYRIVLFDQRGCGRSRPHAALHRNTTWDLVEDMERLREHLGVDRWLLFGGSWGSTLALAYAQTYPQHVRALVLRGIFLLRRRELQWFYQDGASRIFPDAFAEFRAHIPPGERDDLITAYHRRLVSEVPEVRLAAARIWSRWEKRTSYLLPNPQAVEKTDDADYSLAFARLECHYFVHGGFFSSERQLLDGIARIQHLPCTIVQGRYDLVCPMETAWEVHQAWPGSDLRIVDDAGHSAFEPGITRELIAATDRYRAR